MFFGAACSFGFKVFIIVGLFSLCLLILKGVYGSESLHFIIFEGVDDISSCNFPAVWPEHVLTSQLSANLFSRLCKCLSTLTLIFYFQEWPLVAINCLFLAHCTINYSLPQSCSRTTLWLQADSL